MTTLALVAPSDVLTFAGELKPFVDKAAAGSDGKFEPVDIFRVLIQGQWQLWTARDDDGVLKSVLMTRLISFPQVRACEMLAAVGEDRDETMIPFLADIEAWARKQGCGLVQPIARPGWERPLKPHGYQRTHSILEKRIDDAPQS